MSPFRLGMGLGPAASRKLGGGSLPAAPVVGDWNLNVTGVSGELEVEILNSGTATDIKYRVDGGAWVSSGGITTFYIIGLTDDVSVDVELNYVNANGESGAGDLKSATPTVAVTTFDSTLVTFDNNSITFDEAA